MSKIINGLRDAENKKNGNGYASTINKAVSKSSVSGSRPASSNNRARIMAILSFLFVLLLAGINLWQFMIIRGLSSEKANTVAYLNKIERLLSDNTEQIKTISSEIKVINPNLQAINTRIDIETKKISGLQKDNDTQEFAINNLKKSKQTLFERVSFLEVNLDKIKQQIPNRGSTQ